MNKEKIPKAAYAVPLDALNKSAQMRPLVGFEGWSYQDKVFYAASQISAAIAASNAELDVSTVVSDAVVIADRLVSHIYGKAGRQELPR